jgi:hypothetical protein
MTASVTVGLGNLACASKVVKLSAPKTNARKVNWLMSLST